MDSVTDKFEIASEFSQVIITKVNTRNGERLQIKALRRGFTVHLDALQLESLTWQTRQTFSRLLENSVGNGVCTDVPEGR